MSRFQKLNNIKILAKQWKKITRGPRNRYTANIYSRMNSSPRVTRQHRHNSLTQQDIQESKLKIINLDYKVVLVEF